MACTNHPLLDKFAHEFQLFTSSIVHMELELDHIFQTKADALVKRATNGASGSPDWATILQILGMIESKASLVPLFIPIINRYIARGKKNVKMNTLIVIDALFKNSKRAQLEYLQCRELTTALSEQTVAGNPDLHNFLYKAVPAWVANCALHNCLDQRFADWQESVCRTHYVPRLTPALKEKLLGDVDAALEVLVMFAQCIISTFGDGGSPDSPLLQEILPNVREIARRAAELEPTIVDQQLHAALSAVRDFCDYCQQVMNDYKSTGKVDANAVSLQMSKAQRSVRKHVSGEKKAEEPKKRTPPRRRRKGEDEMSVEEFFAEFDKIKGAQPERTDDLLGLDLPTPAEGGARDDLIDALIEL